MDRNQESRITFTITHIKEDMTQIEIARHLNVSPARVYQISKRLKLGYMRIGAGNYRYYNDRDVKLITSIIKKNDAKQKRKQTV